MAADIIVRLVKLASLKGRRLESGIRLVNCILKFLETQSSLNEKHTTEDASRFLLKQTGL